MVEDRRDDARLALTLERTLARHHLVEDGPEREHVAATIGLLALHLLGRHVGDGSKNDAVLGQCRYGWQGGHGDTGRYAGHTQLREAEVEQLRAPTSSG